MFLQNYKKNTGRKDDSKAGDERFPDRFTSQKQSISQFDQVVAGDGNQRGVSHGCQDDVIFSGEHAQQERIDVGDSYDQRQDI